MKCITDLEVPLQTGVYKQNRCREVPLFTLVSGGPHWDKQLGSFHPHGSVKCGFVSAGKQTYK